MILSHMSSFRVCLGGLLFIGFFGGARTVLEKPQLVARDFSETAPAPLFPLKKVLKMAPPSKLFCGAPPEKLERRQEETLANSPLD